jgi:hypothetical protein
MLAYAPLSFRRGVAEFHFVKDIRIVGLHGRVDKTIFANGEGREVKVSSNLFGDVMLKKTTCRFDVGEGFFEECVVNVCYFAIHILIISWFCFVFVIFRWHINCELELHGSIFGSVIPQRDTPIMISC